MHETFSPSEFSSASSDRPVRFTERKSPTDFLLTASEETKLAADYDTWKSLIDATLLNWLNDPQQLEDDGFDAPTKTRIRASLDVAESFHQPLHGLDLVVHPPLHDALVARRDAALEQHVHRIVGDPGDLTAGVEMGMQHDLLAELAAALVHVGERIDPLMVGEQLLWHDRRPLGGEPHAADLVDLEQGHADGADLLGAEVVGITAGDDDVFELGT